MDPQPGGSFATSFRDPVADALFVGEEP